MVIHSVKTRATVANAQAVDYLKELLAKAESGELVEFVAFCKYADGEYDAIWTQGDNRVEMCGMIARAQHLIQCNMDPQE